MLLASLAAYAVNASLSPEEAMRWGWRVPFSFGLLIGPVALYIRAKLDEPEEFLRAEHAAHPMAELVATNKVRMWLAAGLGALVTTDEQLGHGVEILERALHEA